MPRLLGRDPYPELGRGLRFQLTKSSNKGAACLRERRAPYPAPRCAANRLRTTYAQLDPSTGGVKLHRVREQIQEKLPETGWIDECGLGRDGSRSCGTRVPCARISGASSVAQPSSNERNAMARGASPVGPLRSSIGRADRSQDPAGVVLSSCSVLTCSRCSGSSRGSCSRTCAKPRTPFRGAKFMRDAGQEAALGLAGGGRGRRAPPSGPASRA